MTQCKKERKNLDYRLVRAAQKGDEAATMQLIQMNQGFIYRLAKHHRSAKVPIEDLVQEGNCGVLEAIKRFNFKKDVLFLSYASFWIRAYIFKAVMPNMSTSRVRQAFFNYRKAERDLIAKGEDPTIDNIARNLGLDNNDIMTMQFLCGRQMSIDSLENADSSGLMNDIRQNPERDVIHQNTAEIILKIVNRQSPRTRQIVKDIYWSPEGKTNAAIGREIGLSRERVRQIEASGLNQIKADLEKADIDGRSL